ncbi:MAG TPA: DUF1905 domain-containing protein [Kribbella sp.]|uniref:DUF1905 domain-containing protein n=1 Tax=Kribbella sp. TaxID=1871183 RepID=UPI002D77ACDF|nr:DUF1905 domain-containing protein [Kribbella sp.]HET6294486.1 DUF1905 domain-containing protein [Kribbella sp.]
MTGIGVFEFSAVLWVQEGNAQWHFITLPGEISDDIRQLTGSTQRGFGSVRVSVTVGSTTWQTSVFPDSKTGATCSRRRSPSASPRTSWREPLSPYSWKSWTCRKIAEVDCLRTGLA